MIKDISQFRVEYSTPTCSSGIAIVSADGIMSAMKEALDAIHILTGYSSDRVELCAVMEYLSEKPLWLNNHCCQPRKEAI